MNEAENRLQEVEKERDALRDFFDNAPDMFVSVDARTGKIRDCNTTVADVLGVPREKLLGISVLNIYHPDCHDECKRAFREFRATGEARSDLLFLRTADGSRLPVNLRVTAVRSPDGDVLFSRSILRDVTIERELAELKLQNRIQEAQRLECLAVLAGGIAHDFNNLLVAILGNAGLALMQLPAESPVRSIVKDIEVASMRAAELTNQMLAYSGKGRFEVRPVNLSELVKEMSHLLEIAIASNVVMRLDLSDSGVTTDGDVTQLRQVVMNLITNGSDAICEKSGIVTIRTGTAHCAEEDIETMVSGNNVAPGYFAFIEVSDTGIGMEPDVIARMFDPFFSTKHKGHGLGLAAMLGIVQGHHGGIRVYSEPDKGTTIKVYLPLSEDRPAGIQQQTESISGNGLVLVVDDVEAVRASTKRILEFAGYEVLTSEDGQESVEVFRQRVHELSLVLLDMTMPRMEGKDAFREMRRINPDVPVILMSGYNEQDATNEFCGRGLAGFIQKPFKPEDLYRKIAEILGDKKPD